MESPHGDRSGHPLNPPMPVRWLLLAELVLIGLYFADAALGHPSSMVAELLDLDAEANLPTWFSSSQLLVLGLLLGAVAVIRRKEGHPGSTVLFTLPLLCLLASLDEAAGIHEWLGHRSDHLLPERTRTGTLVSKTGIWMLLLAPISR